MSDLNRREFVGAATLAACACLCGIGENAAFAQADSPAASKVVDVGAPADFPAGKISFKFAKSDQVLVVNEAGKIYALNARCTHRGTTVGEKDGVIRCPAHNSTFSVLGTPTGGPAKAALFRYGVTLNDKGHIVVDKSKQYGEKQWEEKDAFVKAS